jgi:oligoribonuclease
MNDCTSLLWIDLEMTGLNPLTDRILEVATIVTNSHLNILANGPVIHLSMPANLKTLQRPWTILSLTHGV